VDEQDLQAILREQRAYYAARATEYDDAYRRTGQYDRGADANTSWQDDLSRLVAAFEQVPVAGDVIELAAGTGQWTQRLVRRARSLHVVDASAEAVAVNRQRLGAAAEQVTYEVADLFHWQPARQWDACVFGFWVCKIPDELITDHLHTVAQTLRPGGAVCLIDKTAMPSDRTEERIERILKDGQRFTIIDRPRAPGRLVELFADAGLHIDVETFGDRFCLGHGIRE
jgi:ubiquinone/menaquinone biosynthesis C-methylase UbiE